MSNSSMVVHTKISPHRTSPRNHKIDKITIHHMAGNASIEACGNVFQKKRASSNYGIGSDGRIAMYVPECDRSWASSNAANDHRAVTIEVANSKSGGNWPVSDKAMASLIDLCVDICRRNDIPKLNFTGNKNGNLTMHCYFAPTACPGTYLKSKFPYIAAEVNKRLAGDEKSAVQEQPETEKPVVNKEPAQVKMDYAASFKNAKAGTYKVRGTTNGLNLRAGASTNKEVLAVLPNGAKVTCYGYYTKSWLYVVTADGKKGFCSSAYLKKV